MFQLIMSDEFEHFLGLNKGKSTIIAFAMVSIFNPMQAQNNAKVTRHD